MHKLIQSCKYIMIYTNLYIYMYIYIILESYIHSFEVRYTL